MSSDGLYLKWKNFDSNIILSFKEIREDQDFTDITLVGEGNLKITAHKVILASSSRFFKYFLTDNSHPHPLIYMRGITAGTLLAMVEFMYQGEVSVQKEDIDEFLSLAKELDIKVLDGKPEEEDYRSMYQQAYSKEKYQYPKYDGARSDVTMKQRTSFVMQEPFQKQETKCLSNPFKIDYSNFHQHEHQKPNGLSKTKTSLLTSDLYVEEEK